MLSESQGSVNFATLSDQAVFANTLFFILDLAKSFWISSNFISRLLYRPVVIMAKQRLFLAKTPRKTEAVASAHLFCQFAEKMIPWTAISRSLPQAERKATAYSRLH